MTNLEWLKTVDADEMAYQFSRMSLSICETPMRRCPFRELCDKMLDAHEYRGCISVIKRWLEEEHE